MLAPGSIPLYTDGNNSETSWVTESSGSPEGRRSMQTHSQGCQKQNSEQMYVHGHIVGMSQLQNVPQHESKFRYNNQWKWKSILKSYCLYIQISNQRFDLVYWRFCSDSPGFSLFRVHSKWAVFILWRITTLPKCCERNGSKTSQQVPLRWVISSLYYIPSCFGEMLLWGNLHVTTEIWRKQEKKLSKFDFLQHIAHHFFSCSSICNKTRHTYINFKLRLTTFSPRSEHDD